MKYGHNIFWCKYWFRKIKESGINAIEFDIVYRLFGKKIFVSHSWRPHNDLYYKSLSAKLSEVAYCNLFTDVKINYVIIESKSFWISQKELYYIMNQYKDCGFQFVMSVQSKWWVPWQIPRGIWLKSFYKKYKKELNILDKRTEETYDGTLLNEQVDLFTKYKNLWQRIKNNQV